MKGQILGIPEMSTTKVSDAIVRRPRQDLRGEEALSELDTNTKGAIIMLDAFHLSWVPKESADGLRTFL